MERPELTSRLCARAIALSIVLAAACGGATSEGLSGDPDPALASGGGGGSSAPAADRGCVQEDCARGEVCRSPEEASWNFCGAPREPACAPGHVGDACGHCFVQCARDEDCAGGGFCNGSYCISARRCATPAPPPP